MIFRAAAAMSIDGRIADFQGRFHRWGSKEDHRFLLELIERHDILIIGRITFEHMAERGSLPKPAVILTRSPMKFTGAQNLRFIDPEKIDITNLLKRLKAKNVLILGGTETYTFFLDRNLIDELYLTIEPMIFGRGHSLFNSVLHRPNLFRLEESCVLNKRGTILLHYSSSK